MRIANLEVVVTDRRGRPVTDLRREEFTLLEDGKERPIANFLAAAGDGADTVAEPGAAAARGESSAAAAPLRLALFVDSFNLHVFNRKSVFRDLVAFVRERPPEIGEMSVVSFDGTFRVRQPLSSDPGRVEAALLAMGDEVGGGIQKEVGHKLAREAVADAQSEQQALAAARAWAAEVRNGSQRTLLALRELVASLAGSEGRSAVLVVSDGFQLRAAEDLFERVAARFRSAEAATEAMAFDASDRFAELAAYANASGVTFYTIGATGLQPPDHVAAQHASPFGGASRGGSNASFRQVAEAMLESMRNAGLREPLEGLAAETGGRALINHATLLEDLREVADELGAVYSLGFEPAPPADGRERRLEVRVARSGVEVRHRGSLRLKTPEERAVDRVLAAVHGVAAANPMGFKVAVGPPPHPRADDGVLVPVAYLVPCKAVALVPEGDARVGRIELLAVARDDAARLSAPVSVVREVRLPPEGPADGFCVARVTLQVRPGRNALGLGVRDLAGGVTSTAVVEIDAVP